MLSLVSHWIPSWACGVQAVLHSYCKLDNSWSIDTCPEDEWPWIRYRAFLETKFKKLNLGHEKKQRKQRWPGGVGCLWRSSWSCFTSRPRGNLCWLELTAAMGLGGRKVVICVKNVEPTRLELGSWVYSILGKELCTSQAGSCSAVHLCYWDWICKTHIQLYCLNGSPCSL